LVGLRTVPDKIRLFTFPLISHIRLASNAGLQTLKNNFAVQNISMQVFGGRAFYWTQRYLMKEMFP
jgi:hypothetical protein